MHKEPPQTSTTLHRQKLLELLESLKALGFPTLLRIPVIPVMPLKILGLPMLLRIPVILDTPLKALGLPTLLESPVILDTPLKALELLMMLEAPVILEMPLKALGLLMMLRIPVFLEIPLKILGLPMRLRIPVILEMPLKAPGPPTLLGTPVILDAPMMVGAALMAQMAQVVGASAGSREEMPLRVVFQFVQEAARPVGTVRLVATVRCLPLFQRKPRQELSFADHHPLAALNHGLS